MSNLLHRVSQNFNKSDSPPEPSRDTTAGIARNPPLNGIPKNILAFRTITKLLSLIQQERAFRALQPRSEDNRRLELKLINALATVAVIEHEVVAVVNNINSGTLDRDSDKLDRDSDKLDRDSDKLDRDSNKLDLLVSVEPSNDENLCILPSEPPAPYHWRVLLSKNFRFSDPKPNSTGQPTIQPTISSAEALADLGLVGNEAIKQYAGECW